MADQEYKVRISVDGAQQAQAAVGGVDKSLAGMGRAALAAGAALFTAQGVIAGIRALEGLSDRAARVDKVAAAFDGLTKKAKFTGDTLLQMQAATRGAVTDFELMRQTNNALLLGVGKSSGQMAEMAEIARRLGAAMGIDTAQALESLVIGIGRQSRLWLDNLGIIVDVDSAYRKYADSLGKGVDQLTDYEKKLAFSNETMKSARDLVSGLGDDLVTQADKVARAKAEWENFKDEVGSGFQSAAQEGAGFLRALALVASSPFSDVARKEIVESLQRMKDEEIAAAAQTQDFSKALTEQDVFMAALAAQTRSKAEADALAAAASLAATEAAKEQAKADEEAARKRYEANVAETEAIATQIALRNEAQAFTESMIVSTDDEIASLEDYDMTMYATAETLAFLGETERKVAKIEADRADAKRQAVSNAIGDMARMNQAAKGSALVTKRLMQAQAAVDARKAYTGTFAMTSGLFPPPVPQILSGIAFAAAMSQVAAIESQSFREGGVIEGAGGPRQDNVRINASPGESILNAEATSRLGRDGIDRLNSGGGAGVTVNIYGGMIGNEGFVRDVMIPQIEASLKRRLA